MSSSNMNHGDQSKENEFAFDSPEFRKLMEGYVNDIYRQFNVKKDNANAEISVEVEMNRGLFIQLMKSREENDNLKQENDNLKQENDNLRGLRKKLVELSADKWILKDELQNKSKEIKELKYRILKSTNQKNNSKTGKSHSSDAVSLLSKINRKICPM